MKTIDLYNLEIECEFEYEKSHTNFTPGGDEHIPEKATLTSCKSKGIEIITLLTDEDIQQLEEEFLASKD